MFSPALSRLSWIEIYYTRSSCGEMAPRRSKDTLPIHLFITDCDFSSPYYAFINVAPVKIVLLEPTAGTGWEVRRRWVWADDGTNEWSGLIHLRGDCVQLCGANSAPNESPWVSCEYVRLLAAARVNAAGNTGQMCINSQQRAVVRIYEDENAMLNKKQAITFLDFVGQRFKSHLSRCRLLSCLWARHFLERTPCFLSFVSKWTMLMNDRNERIMNLWLCCFCLFVLISEMNDTSCNFMKNTVSLKFQFQNITKK